jgi:putative salt-induced outer membrane protein
MQLRALLLPALVLTPVAAFSDEAPAPTQDTLTGKGQVGIFASQGNTEARSVNAALDMAMTTANWQHALHLGGLYSQSAGITSGERWDALWQSSYDITHELYTFGALRYERDLFSGFELQASASAGLGYRLFQRKETRLAVQLGAGFREERPQKLIDNTTGQVLARIFGRSSGGAILSAGVDYSQALTATTVLADKLLVESGRGNTLYSNLLSLAVRISTRLALSVGYDIQDNTSPPPGLRQLDTIETVNLVYSF